MTFLVLAALLAVPAIVHAGWAPLLVGIVGAVCVLTYSGGIVPISYLPIGEFVSGFVMGGLIPLGIVATACSAFDFTVLIAAMPLIIGIGLIMMTNNTCDIEKTGLPIAGHYLHCWDGRRHGVYIASSS